MTTAVVDEEINPINEEPASKKIRLDDEPSSNNEDPSEDREDRTDNSLLANDNTQSNELSQAQVYKHNVVLTCDFCVAVRGKP